MTNTQLQPRFTYSFKVYDEQTLQYLGDVQFKATDHKLWLDNPTIGKSKTLDGENYYCYFKKHELAQDNFVEIYYTTKKEQFDIYNSS